MEENLFKYLEPCIEKMNFPQDLFFRIIKRKRTFHVWIYNLMRKYSHNDMFGSAAEEDLSKWEEKNIFRKSL